MVLLRRSFFNLYATSNSINKTSIQGLCFSIHRTYSTGTNDDNKSTVTSSYETPDPSQFPWLLSTASPRIKDYPYIKAPSDWGFLNILPVKLQHMLCQFFGHRMLQLNMGDTYFPDQFLLGASQGTRKALESISQFLTHPSDDTMKQVNALISPRLQHALLGKAEGSFGIHDEISIGLPQIYDARVRDIWVTLGNIDALEKPRQYEIIRWMTLMVALKRSKVDALEEPFADYRKRMAKGLMEGAHVAVDVEIDAEVEYQILRPKIVTRQSVETDEDEGSNNIMEKSATGTPEVILFDRGRRTLMVRFESPYFVPADAIVSDVDASGEPINNWQWRISDIDQLIQKQDLDADSDDHDTDD